MLAVLEPLRNQIKRYTADLARKDKNAAASDKLDFEALARQHGLSFARMEKVSRWDVQDLEIGRSYLIGTQRGFVEYVFAQPGLGRPAISQDTESNKYLFWKSDESKEHVPELSEPGIKERVVRAWKMIEARRLAQEEAKRLQTKASQAKTDLKEALKDEPDVQVIEPPAFSWMTYGAVPAMYAQSPPRLSHVEGAQALGNEFMEAVFSLREGEVGVAVNRPQDHVYVVQVHTYTPAEAVLRESFLVDDFRKYAAVAYADHQALQFAWMKELRESSGFQWKREPDVQREPTGPVGEPQPIEFPEF